MKYNFTQEDIDFLLNQDSPNRGTPLTQTIAEGYARNLDEGVKTQFANIKRRVLDPDFILSPWCNDCVFKMLKDVYAAFVIYQAVPVDPASTPAEDAPPGGPSDQTDPQAESGVGEALTGNDTSQTNGADSAPQKTSRKSK